MNYKIAVASCDGNFVDASFGNATSMNIIEVNNNGSYIKIEERQMSPMASIEEKVNMISDCRCIICRKAGPSAILQLERKALETFQMDCKIDEALVRVIEYYLKIDYNLTLRKAR